MIKGRVDERYNVAIQDLQSKLEALIKGLPVAGFDAVPDSTIADLSSYAGEAEGLGMKSGKEVLDNLIKTLKTRKTGGNTDDSVMVRLTALEFYIDKLKSGDTSDL
jgi:hypothetical protein